MIAAVCSVEPCRGFDPRGAAFSLTNPTFWNTLNAKQSVHRAVPLHPFIRKRKPNSIMSLRLLSREELRKKQVFFGSNITTDTARSLAARGGIAIFEEDYPEGGAEDQSGRTSQIYAPENVSVQLRRNGLGWDAEADYPCIFVPEGTEGSLNRLRGIFKEENLIEFDSADQDIFLGRVESATPPEVRLQRSMERLINLPEKLLLQNLEYRAALFWSLFNARRPVFNHGHASVDVILHVCGEECQRRKATSGVFAGMDPCFYTEPDERDLQVAASIIQWLGTHDGQAFLQEFQKFLREPEMAFA